MRLIVYLMVLLAGVMGTSYAFAQDTPPKTAEAPKSEAQNIQVHLIAIYATKKQPDSEEKIDPSLAALKGKLERGFDGYGNFERVGESRLTIALGKGESASLPNGSKVSITYLGEDDRFAKLKFEIPEKVSTKLKTARGSIFFQAGLAYKEGILIVAIEVK